MHGPPSWATILPSSGFGPGVMPLRSPFHRSVTRHVTYYSRVSPATDGDAQDGWARPCDATKARLIAEAAKEISQPDN